MFYRLLCQFFNAVPEWEREVRRVWKDLRMTICGYFGPSHSPVSSWDVDKVFGKAVWGVRDMLHMGCVASVQFKFVLQGSFWYHCAPDNIMEGLCYQRLGRWCISKWKISIVIHIIKSTNPIIMAQLLHPVTVWKTGCVFHDAVTEGNILK